MTDVGLRRASNQDSYGYQLAGSEQDWLRRGHLFIVADGMGAHAAGERASKMAVDHITLNYSKSDGPPGESLKASVVSANAKIHSTGEDNPDFKGMGTTCDSLLLLPYGAVAAHVGDSRVYRLRGTRFEQLSRDHSLVWEMMAQRGVAEQELAGHIPKNIITRSLGPSAEVQVDLEGPFPYEPGDTFLMCSDGLSGQVRDEEMGAILAVMPPNEAVRVLIELANLRGGPDNITVIVVRVKQVDPHWASQAWAAKSGGGAAVHPLLWVGAGVCIALGAILYLSGHSIPGLIAGLSGLGVLGFAALQKLGGGGGSGGGYTTMLGTGPHRSYDSTPNRELLDDLETLVDPVCQTARQQNWQIDWQRFERFRSASKAASDRYDFAGALRELCRGISFLMQEVREQQNR